MASSSPRAGAGLHPTCVLREVDAATNEDARELYTNSMPREGKRSGASAQSAEREHLAGRKPQAVLLCQLRQERP